MPKVVWEGEVDIGDGEKVVITVRRSSAVPTGKYELYAEGTYQGQHFSIDDHGNGLDYLKHLVVNHCSIKKSKP